MPATTLSHNHTLLVNQTQNLLLAHSVQRPPYSIGLFSHSEFQRILTWALDSYYRHYKLYQYAYTNRCVCVCVFRDGKQ